MHDNLQLGARDKVVQKMTRDGAVEENLSEHSTKRVSARAEDAELAKPVETDKASEANPVEKKKVRHRTLERELRVENSEVSADTEKGTVSVTADTENSGEAALSDTTDQLQESTGESSSLREHSVRSERGVPEKAGSGAKKKKQRKRIYEEQKKQQKTRLHFEDEPGLSSASETVKGASAGNAGAVLSGAIGKPGRIASLKAHEKLDEVQDENSAVEAAHRTEEAAEGAGSRLRSRVSGGRVSEKRISKRVNVTGRDAAEKTSRLRFEGAADDDKVAGTFASQKKAVKKNELQKKQYRKEYASKKRKLNAKKTAASKVKKKAESVADGTGKVVKRVFTKSKGWLIGLLCFGIIGTILVQGIGMMGAAIVTENEGVLQSSYLASDDEIYAAEAAYTELQSALQNQINGIEEQYPGYDEYRYQVDEISFNPYTLTSYLTVKYGNYTAEQVQAELEDLFRAQYSMSVRGTTETVTDTRTVRVGESLGNVVTSGYCNCRICCGSWSGGPTASGVYPTAAHTIAVDAHNPIVPMGTKIVMNGTEYTVEDTGNFARYGVAFDVYYDSHSAASAHGHRTWEAYIADDNGSQTVEVTQTRTVRVLNVSLTNAGLDMVARNRLAALDAEATGWFNLLCASYGNRDYLWDRAVYAGYNPGGMSYEIPPEALNDVRFRNMITEAERYLGYPYVWGGASPSTSFDCSGFVSWVINNCGNGWSYGRLTAEGLRGICTYVSPAQAKPGDLIFFQGTYDTSGASHVGIYVGNGMMIHCGNPIQYASIETSYWQEHFLCFGRLN